MAQPCEPTYAIWDQQGEQAEETADLDIKIQLFFFPHGLFLLLVHAV